MEITLRYREDCGGNEDVGETYYKKVNIPGETDASELCKKLWVDLIIEFEGDDKRGYNIGSWRDKGLLEEGKTYSLGRKDGIRGQKSFLSNLKSFKWD